MTEGTREDHKISLRDEAREIFSKYPNGKERSALLPLLALAQRRDGYITPMAIEEIANILSLSSAEVRSVASFYHMFKLKPVGKHIVSVCHTLACAMAGAGSIIKKLEVELDVHSGETTSDGAITLERVECLAACDLAPMLQVDYDVVHGHMDQSKCEELIESLRASTASDAQTAVFTDPGDLEEIEPLLIDSIALSHEEEHVLHPEPNHENGEEQ